MPSSGHPRSRYSRRRTSERRLKPIFKKNPPQVHLGPGPVGCRGEEEGARVQRLLPVVDGDGVSVCLSGCVGVGVRLCVFEWVCGCV